MGVELEPQLLKLKVTEDFPNKTPLRKGDVVTHEEGKFIRNYAVVQGRGLTWFIESNFLRRFYKHEHDDTINR